MRVKLLLFAVYRDLAGTEELDVDMPVGATAHDLVAELRSKRGLDALPARPALAVNQTWAPLSTVLREGDEVALLPPVSGG